ncbi:hypothetical protein IFM47457_10842 [Aspergillus lentulus]|nr:hypothetical protein IFM47457_10842 [Aspergillus lentulus]
MPVYFLVQLSGGWGTAAYFECFHNKRHYSPGCPRHAKSRRQAPVTASAPDGFLDLVKSPHSANSERSVFSAFRERYAFNVDYGSEPSRLPHKLRQPYCASLAPQEGCHPECQETDGFVTKCVPAAIIEVRNSDCPIYVGDWSLEE